MLGPVQEETGMRNRTETDGIKLAEETRQRRSRTALIFYIYFSGLGNMGKDLLSKYNFSPKEVL